MRFEIADFVNPASTSCVVVTIPCCTRATRAIRESTEALWQTTRTLRSLAYLILPLAAKTVSNVGFGHGAGADGPFVETGPIDEGGDGAELELTHAGR